MEKNLPKYLALRVLGENLENIAYVQRNIRSIYVW